MAALTAAEVDLRHANEWNPKYLWVCDIEEKVGESDNDFLFLANIQSGGTTSEKPPAGSTAGRCIFSSVMYDIQHFVPDVDKDGKLNFELDFGVNTAERKDSPAGWKIAFINLVPSDASNERYSGTCSTSWWGERPVQVISYMTLSPEEKARYPDLVATYYQSLPV